MISTLVLALALAQADVPSAYEIPEGSLLSLDGRIIKLPAGWFLRADTMAGLESEVKELRGDTQRRLIAAVIIASVAGILAGGAVMCIAAGPVCPLRVQ